MTLLSDVSKLGKADARGAENLGKQIQDGFATESCRRQEDHKKMEEAMTTMRATSQRTGTKGINGWT